MKIVRNIIVAGGLATILLAANADAQENYPQIPDFERLVASYQTLTRQLTLQNPNESCNVNLNQVKNFYELMMDMYRFEEAVKSQETESGVKITKDNLKNYGLLEEKWTKIENKFKMYFDEDMDEKKKDTGLLVLLNPCTTLPIYIARTLAQHYGDVQLSDRQFLEERNFNIK